MKLYLLIVILVGSAGAALSQATDQGPVFESWNEVQVIVPLVRAKDSDGKTITRLSVTFGGILRLGRSGPDAVDRRGGVIFDLRVNRHLSLLAGALYRKDEVAENIPHSETRVDLGVLLSKTWGNVTIRDRDLYEHRFRNGRPNTDLYRQRLQLGYTIRHHKKVLFTPFISDEVYLDIGARHWTQNEFYAGISRSISRTMSVDIAYLRNDSKPRNVNGLAVTWKIDLR